MFARGVRSAMLVIACILGVISFIIFMSITFASSPHKDFERHLNYRTVPSGCDITNSSLSEYWYMDVSCETCGEAADNEPYCNNLENEWSSWNPTTCQNTNNECPVAQSCGGGSYDSCSICSYQVCSGRNYCQTYTYTCCECSPSYIHNQACYITPSIGYRATLDIVYTSPTNNQEIIHTTYTQDFGTNHAGAVEYLSQEYRVNGVYPCYYEPSNTSQILFDLNFTIVPLVFSMIFAFLLLSSFVLLTVAWLVYTQYDASLVFLVWMWIIGFFIFLPVSTAPNVSSDVALALRLTGCQLVGFSLLPLVLCISNTVESMKFLLVWGYTFFYYIPSGFLIPLYQQILKGNDHVGTIVYLVILSTSAGIMLILILYYFYYLMVFGSKQARSVNTIELS